MKPIREARKDGYHWFVRGDDEIYIMNHSDRLSKTKLKTHCRFSEMKFNEVHNKEVVEWVNYVIDTKKYINRSDFATFIKNVNSPRIMPIEKDNTKHMHWIDIDNSKSKYKRGDIVLLKTASTGTPYLYQLEKLTSYNDKTKTNTWRIRSGFSIAMSNYHKSVTPSKHVHIEEKDIVRVVTDVWEIEYFNECINNKYVYHYNILRDQHSSLDSNPNVYEVNDIVLVRNGNSGSTFMAQLTNFTSLSFWRCNTWYCIEDIGCKIPRSYTNFNAKHFIRKATPHEVKHFHDCITADFIVPLPCDLSSVPETSIKEMQTKGRHDMEHVNFDISAWDTSSSIDMQKMFVDMANAPFVDVEFTTKGQTYQENVPIYFGTPIEKEPLLIKQPIKLTVTKFKTYEY